MAVGGRIDIDEAALQAYLTSPTGDVAEFLVDVTQQVVQEAKRRAPVGQPSHTPAGHPAGFLRSSIGWSFEDRSGSDLVTRVDAPALTSSANPFPGEPYGLHIEKPETRPRKPPPFARDDEPFLVPALRHVIGGL